MWQRDDDHCCQRCDGGHQPHSQIGAAAAVKAGLANDEQGSDHDDAGAADPHGAADESRNAERGDRDDQDAVSKRARTRP